MIDELKSSLCISIRISVLMSCANTISGEIVAKPYTYKES